MIQNLNKKNLLQELDQNEMGPYGKDQLSHNKIIIETGSVILSYLSIYRAHTSCKFKTYIVCLWMTLSELHQIKDQPSPTALNGKY